ncbi:sensor histidine kinase [Vitiosangium sp. GDMCC 1.1324]|uniref:sensor histidine kinase n=1 Tax=Vitiosangium sp. (strain GDMCC 1.1324) TaxID=2138576 RepID=UPI000D3978C7|nr:sensor histidine kinase [Vitiosangium sp. GDMCC 1.1324]PTL81355.1 ATPase [Vitiosangium sp. GDMCC 1.1324]
MAATKVRGPTPLWRQVLFLGLVAVLASFADVARASGQDRRLSQFHHTRWTIKEGAPGQISAIAQTEDGYLWLSAAATLYRFDGVRFERFEPPSGEPITTIQTLYAPPGGGLWIGFQFGGVAFLQAGRVTWYRGTEGAPVNQVSAFATDRDGNVWASSRNEGLFRLSGSRWEKIGESWGYPGDQARSLFVDRDGVLWVATGKTLLYLPRDARRFVPTSASVGWVFQLLQAPDGKIWMSEMGGDVRPIPVPGYGQTEKPPALHVESASLLFARDGSLWIPTLGDGIRRIARPDRLPAGDAMAASGAVESFTERDGLSADYAWPVLEDREGNVWVGTSGGLDRFRASSMVLAEFPRGSHDFALAAGEGGAVWAGTTNRPLMRLHDGEVAFEHLDPAVRSAYRDEEGVVWLGADNGLWRVEDGRLSHVTPMPQDSATTMQVQAMTRDRRGTLWVSLTNLGLMQWSDGRWSSAKARLGLPDDAVIHTAMTDGRGRVWLGHRQGTITRVDGDELKRFTDADGLKLGAITALASGGRYVWAGGQFGLAFYDGERFRPLLADGDEPFRGVSGIVERSDGSVWVHAVPGVYHLTAEEIQRAVGDPNHRVRYELFDFLDGLPARPTLLRPLPTVVAGDDGRLWFATSNGVVWIDPERIVRNSLPPPVSIVAVQADGHRYALASDVTLPIHPVNLEIDYAALSLSIPERVRFRYQLEGVDERWQDVGTRRAAYYGNLAPGRYRFRVMASNNDGVWNEQGASIELVVPPAFYQTWWFRTLCVAAGLLLLWGMYLLRLRQLTAKVRGRLEERHAERERIARELHDTLLQSVHGLVLRFQAVAEQLPEHAPARQALEKALDRADEVLTEGRDRVTELRSSANGGRDLSDALMRVGEDLAEDIPMSFRLIVEGMPQELDAAAQAEIFLIGREALVNAFQHARGSAVEVELCYVCNELLVSFRDDGVGMAPEILEMGGRPGGGLAGMRERAARLGATLHVWGGADAGTEVELRVPAAIAYRVRPRGTWRAWLRSSFRVRRGRSSRPGRS